MNINKNNRKTGFTLVEIMIVVAIIGLLAAIAIPNFVKARKTAQRNACIRNLQQIDGAREQWALENKKSEGTDTASAVTAINDYIKGQQTPKCPAGGTYDYKPIGTSPTCTIDGHSI